MPFATKAYHCKVLQLTKSKQSALQQEYDNLQHYIQTREDLGVYSANKQQADRFYKHIKKGTKYPLSIRNDLIKLEHDPSKIAEYWVRVPVKAVKGGLWIGLIKPYEPIPKDVKICECKLYKRDNKWFLDVVVKKDVPEKTEYQNVIAIDMGIKHNITRDIINRALETDSLIVLGRLKGLRSRGHKQNSGKKFNRKLSGFPYYKFTEYLSYKAALAGIKVIKVFEDWTSQICRRCGDRGRRPTQGLFLCNKCGKKMLIETLLSILAIGL